MSHFPPKKNQSQQNQEAKQPPQKKKIHKQKFPGHFLFNPMVTWHMVKPVPKR